MNGTLKYLPCSEKTRELVTKWLNLFDDGHTYLSQEESDSSGDDSSNFEGDDETNSRDCRLVSIHKKARQLELTASHGLLINNWKGSTAFHGGCAASRKRSTDSQGGPPSISQGSKDSVKDHSHEPPPKRQKPMVRIQNHQTNLAHQTSCGLTLHPW